MSSVVFQELREARALAYSAQAQYAQGGRLDAENLGLGAISSQNDKTVDALGAFLDLFENMPVSGERFEESKSALANRYRTSTVGFRRINSTVRSWEQLGITDDPRASRFDQLQRSTLEDMLAFQREHIAGKAKLISIVGDMSRIDEQALADVAEVPAIDVDAAFC